VVQIKPQIVLSFLVISALCSAPAPLRAADEEMTLARLRVLVRTELTSIASISCRYRMKHSKEDGDDPKNWPVHEWAEQGSRKLCRMLPWQPPHLKGGWLQQWMSYDGQVGYLVIFRIDTDEIDTIQKFDRIPDGYGVHAVPAVYIGRSVYNSNESLLDLLARPDAKLQRKHMFNGHECYLVDLGPYDRLGQRLNYLRVWIDPAVGYLPRHISSIPVRFMDAKSDDERRQFQLVEGEDLWLLDVDDFVEVDDPVMGRRRWFPRTLKHSGKVAAVVDSVSINHSLSNESFVPQATTGVRIVHNPRSAQERTEIVGATAASIHPVAVESKPVTKANSPVRAAPVSRSWRSVFLVFGLACVITATLAFACRRMLK
jgi:hypothetical protein